MNNWWLSGKELACQFRRYRFNSWLRKIPWRGKWQPTPIFLPGKSHGQRKLVGYNPWGLKRVGHNLATKQQQQWSWIQSTCSINYRKRNVEIPKIVYFSISHLCSTDFCFKNFEALLLSEHTFRIMMPSWKICLFIKGLIIFLFFLGNIPFEVYFILY